MTAPTPVLTAFLVCDQIVADAATSKKTIVGIFDSIFASQFPTQHAPCSLYVKLIDCEGDYEFRIEFVRVSTQELLVGFNGNANPKTRHEYTEFSIQCPPLPLPEPGQYEFRLWMNNKFIGNVRINASQQVVDRS